MGLGLFVVFSPNTKISQLKEATKRSIKMNKPRLDTALIDEIVFSEAFNSDVHHIRVRELKGRHAREMVTFPEA